MSFRERLRIVIPVLSRLGLHPSPTDYEIHENALINAPPSPSLWEGRTRERPGRGTGYQFKSIAVRSNTHFAQRFSPKPFQSLQSSVRLPSFPLRPSEEAASGEDSLSRIAAFGASGARSCIIPEPRPWRRLNSYFNPNCIAIARPTASTSSSTSSFVNRITRQPR